jgi:hypothetical protein
MSKGASNAEPFSAGIDAKQYEIAVLINELAPNVFEKSERAWVWMECVDDPAHPEYDILTGDLFLKANSNRATEFYQRAIKKQPDSWDYQGKLRIATQNQELIEHALANGSPTIQVRFASNVIEKWNDREAKQRRAFQLLAAAHSDDAGARLLSGTFLANGGDFLGATRQWICDADRDEVEDGVGFVPIPNFEEDDVDFCPFGQFTFAFLKSERSEFDTERWQWLGSAASWIDFLLPDASLEAVLWKQVSLNPAFDGIHEFSSWLPSFIQTVAQHSRDKLLTCALYACLRPRNDSDSKVAKSVKNVLRQSFSDVEAVIQSPKDWVNYRPIVVKV